MRHFAHDIHTQSCKQILFFLPHPHFVCSLTRTSCVPSPETLDKIVCSLRAALRWQLFAAVRSVWHFTYHLYGVTAMPTKVRRDCTNCPTRPSPTITPANPAKVLAVRDLPTWGGRKIYAGTGRQYHYRYFACVQGVCHQTHHLLPYNAELGVATAHKPIDHSRFNLFQFSSISMCALNLWNAGGFTI